MTRKIDCFIPWNEEQQNLATESILKNDKNVTEVYHLTESIGSPKTIKYIAVKPRMKLYMKKSAEIYSIYLQYISREDIHVYSIDEVFCDIIEIVTKDSGEVLPLIMPPRIILIIIW